MHKTSPIENAPSRPLSPHLQIYRKQLTSVLSISHRLSGLALAIGIGFFVWWLTAAASGPGDYVAFTAFCASAPGQFLLFGWSACLLYHLASGIRHLFWDVGLFLDLKNVYATGWFVVAFTVASTAALWLWVWFGR